MSDLLTEGHSVLSFSPDDSIASAVIQIRHEQEFSQATTQGEWNKEISHHPEGLTMTDPIHFEGLHLLAECCVDILTRQEHKSTQETTTGECDEGILHSLEGLALTDPTHFEGLHWLFREDAEPPAHQGCEVEVDYLGQGHSEQGDSTLGFYPKG